MLQTSLTILAVILVLTLIISLVGGCVNCGTTERADTLAPPLIPMLPEEASEPNESMHAQAAATVKEGFEGENVVPHEADPNTFSSVEGFEDGLGVEDSKKIMSELRLKEAH
jgi:hypothetical protein